MLYEVITIDLIEREDDDYLDFEDQDEDEDE